MTDLPHYDPFLYSCHSRTGDKHSSQTVPDIISSGLKLTSWVASGTMSYSTTYVNQTANAAIESSVTLNARAIRIREPAEQSSMVTIKDLFSRISAKGKQHSMPIAYLTWVSIATKSRLPDQPEKCRLSGPVTIECNIKWPQ